MAKVQCPCGNNLNLSPIPCEITFHLFTQEYLAALYHLSKRKNVITEIRREMTEIDICCQCGRLLIFWNANDPPEYYHPIEVDDDLISKDTASDFDAVPQYRLLSNTALHTMYNLKKKSWIIKAIDELAAFVYLGNDRRFLTIFWNRDTAPKRYVYEDFQSAWDNPKAI